MYYDNLDSSGFLSVPDPSTIQRILFLQPPSVAVHHESEDATQNLNLKQHQKFSESNLCFIFWKPFF